MLLVYCTHHIDGSRIDHPICAHTAPGLEANRQVEQKPEEEEEENEQH